MPCFMPCSLSRAQWLLLCHSLLCGVSLQANAAPIPPEAIALLNQIPGRTLSFEYVRDQAVRVSDSFREVWADARSISATELETKGLLDPRWAVEAGKVWDRTKPLIAFSPSAQFVSRGAVSLSGQSATGTQYGLAVEHQQVDIAFQSFPGISTKESRGKFSLSQSLWRDAFGQSLRATTESGRLMTAAQREVVRDRLEGWQEGLANLYYAAWFSQAQANASSAAFKRLERLLDASRVRLKRGTMEQPDYLQVESRLLIAEAQRAADLQSVEDRWRDLVTSLKLPDSLLGIDPLIVPLKLDTIVTPALGSCRADGVLAQAPESSTRVRAAEALKNAASARAQSAASQAKPDLRLEGSLTTNGVDPDFHSTWTSAAALNHPAWAVGIKLTAPLFFSAERAAETRALTESIRSDAQWESARNNHRVEWINACAELERLERTFGLYRRTSELSLKRAGLESERFRIGRGSTDLLILAEDDATRAELMLQSLEVQRRQAAWRVHRLTGKAWNDLEPIVRKHHGAQPGAEGGIL